MPTYSDLPKYCAVCADGDVLFTVPNDCNAEFGIRKGDHIIIDIGTLPTFGDLAIARDRDSRLYVYRYGYGLGSYPGGDFSNAPDWLYGRVKGVLRLFERRCGISLQVN